MTEEEKPKGLKVLSSDTEETEAEPELSFAEVMRKNQETKDRLKAERSKANKRVVRDFNLKPGKR